MLILRRADGTLEEVTEKVFELRDKIVEDDGRPRYSEGYAKVVNNCLDIQMPLTAANYSLLGRSIGVNVPTNSRMGQVPEFVRYQKKKGGKLYILATESGQTFS